MCHDPQAGVSLNWLVTSKYDHTGQARSTSWLAGTFLNCLLATMMSHFGNCVELTDPKDVNLFVSQREVLIQIYYSGL